MFDKIWHDIWIAMFALLIVVGVFSGQGLVIGLGAMGLVVAGVSWVWNRLSLEEVYYERDIERRRVFIDEETRMTLSVMNRKPLPLGRLSVVDEAPDEVEVVDARMALSSSPNSKVIMHSASLAWYERVRWEYKIKGVRRGYYRIGPARMESGDLFGFFKSYKEVDGNDYLLVYPKVVPLPELGLPAVRPLGETRGGIRIFQDESRPAGLRDYQIGDPLKIVDWKATAKMRGLQVRTFEPSSAFTVIIVALIETSERTWEGYSPINLERVITSAASVASYASERQYSVGLFSNGTPILADRPMRLNPSSDPDQLTLILEALATIRPLAIGPMAPQLEQHSRRFPMGSTLVVIAAMLTQDMVLAMEDLRAKGHKLVVIFVGDAEPPDMPDGVILHDLRMHFENMELASEFGPR